MIPTGNEFLCVGKNCWQQNCIAFCLRKHIWFGIWALWSDEKNPYFSASFLKSELHKNFFFRFEFKFLSTSLLFFPNRFFLCFNLWCIKLAFSVVWKGDLIFREFFCYKVFFRARSNRFILECFNYKAFINRQKDVV